MPEKSSSTSFELPAEMVQPWLMAQAISPDLMASPFQRTLAAREKILDEYQRFTDAWCERHLEANADVIDHVRKGADGNGPGMPMTPLNGWVMKAVQALSEDMSGAMALWMNCARHWMNEGQPALEETVEEVRERTAAATQKTK